MFKKPIIGVKAQSIIIQFMIFFLAGLMVYISVGTLFRTQTDVFREDVAAASLKLSSSYISAYAIASVGCRECSRVQTKLSISNATAGYFTEVFFGSSGIKTSTAPPSKQFTSSMHNLNETFKSGMSGQAPSIRYITLTYERDQNKLWVSQT